MCHMAASLHINSFAVDGTPLPGHVHGGVLVPSAGTQWLVHLTTTRSIELTVGTEYRLQIGTREGVTIDHTAHLRRSDGQAHYFVGVDVPAGLGNG
jgi:hypothetical protein